ncbi:RNA polymerase sigma-70 factor [Pseudobacter ginsenosidimutans]|uniref:RNA polymerase sigma-70 factor (ECF subfamily) n=1 Tax=Pseudobacter ginsenosidimutans TaxID=661488 RepID=A0A4Q7N245_9BACT|nr:RNA polymerase sigma-70 factor [Pseudobacter ginsenosidimutans]QEC44092.1 RNA polymerase sigma-70 factor [Pseudobacter ginsenosidimutans]RZS75533.1 RNA polymerase sigma-70 factor (ECF subfamily) [Pseudobacter ginsenosidimutans]
MAAIHFTLPQPQQQTKCLFVRAPLMEGKIGNIIDLSHLESLFREYYHRLCNASYYITGNEDAAKDIVQDFFFHCWNKKEELAITGDFKYYALRAVKNASINYIRDNKKFTSVKDPENNLKVAEQPVPSFDDMGEEEKNRELWNAIERLPAQRKAIFLSSNKDGLTYAQTAERMGVSVNTVKTQIRLAYQFLREECAWLLHFLILWIGLKK